MKFRIILPALAFALGSVVPVQASLVITPIWDSSITNDLANGAQIQGIINQAILFFESTYVNPINVCIEFEEMSTGLGSSQVGFTYNQPYQAFYNALVTTNANPAAIAGLTLNNGNNANNPVTGTGVINVKSANERAVGLAGAPVCNVIGTAGNLMCDPANSSSANAIDGIIGLNTSMTSPPGAESSDYDLLSVTEHEIDEVLGLGSALPNCPTDTVKDCIAKPPTAANPAPEDLFRYTAAGTFATLTINCAALPPQAYFSYSGATVIQNTSTVCNGDDWGDWKGGATPQVQDAEGTPGVLVPYGPTEIAAMSAIGYQLAPEPGTWALMLSSIGVLAVAAKRRYTRKPPQS